MSQFASVEELSELAGQEFDTDQQRRARLLLQLASSAIQNLAKQRFDYVEDDPVTLQQTASRSVRLPERPVVAVDSVKVNGFSVTGFEWDASGRVWWLGPSTVDFASVAINAPEVEGDGQSKIDVVYSHGYEELPDDIRLICLSAAARAMQYQVENAEGPGLTLTTEEQAIIRKYRSAV